MKTLIPIIDLHTDFILGEADLAKKIFDIDTSKQISKRLVDSSGVELLLAGFSYDNEKNCTNIMLSEMKRFIKKRKPKFKIIFHIEGAGIIKTKKDLVDFYKNGVRSIGLAHTHDNGLVGSSSGEKQYGLTPLGKRVIREALKMGILIDLAHMSKRGFNDTLKLIGDKPPLVSHTACYSINKNPRNISDSQIKQVAKRNGVIGIFFSGKYINGLSKPKISDVLKHIEHIIKLVGVNHVAIGSDFGGITTGTPTGLESIDKLQSLFRKLLSRGYTSEDVEKIAHLNAKRVLSCYNIF